MAGTGRTCAWSTCVWVQAAGFCGVGRGKRAGRRRGVREWWRGGGGVVGATRLDPSLTFSLSLSFFCLPALTSAPIGGAAHCTSRRPALRAHTRVTDPARRSSSEKRRQNKGKERGQVRAAHILTSLRPPTLSSPSPRPAPARPVCSALVPPALARGTDASARAVCLGRTAMTMGIALPKWIVQREYSALVRVQTALSTPQRCQESTDGRDSLRGWVATHRFSACTWPASWPWSSESSSGGAGRASTFPTTC